MRLQELIDFEPKQTKRTAGEHSANMQRSADHKFSIFDGFMNNIDPKIISSQGNLQILSAHDNVIKNFGSVISIHDLMSTYNE
jgi:hypothetical protein